MRGCIRHSIRDPNPELLGFQRDMDAVSFWGLGERCVLPLGTPAQHCTIWFNVNRMLRGTEQAGVDDMKMMAQLLHKMSQRDLAGKQYRFI